MTKMIKRNDSCRLFLAAFAACTLAACSAGAPAGSGVSGAPATFRSAQAAAQALVDAVEKYDRAALLAILGAGSEDLVDSGDEVADRSAARAFVAAARERLDVEKVDQDHAVLFYGADDRPFAIPLVRKGRAWSFDAATGREELLNRRIGRNEIHAISACLAYVEAQRDYAARLKKSRGRVEYARKIRSTPGRRDGLFWEARDGEPESPLGPRFAVAEAEGYELGDGDAATEPFHGYHYRILEAQGPRAPGGKRSYLQGGRLTGGFALVAWPHEYGNSGVMTFVVNQLGIVFQKDLGANGAEIAAAMTAYDPDDSWDPAGPVAIDDDEPND